MPASRFVPGVAIVDTAPDLTDLLITRIQEEGVAIIAAYTHAITQGQLDFAAWLTEHQPQAAIWDVAVPYAEHWAFFQTIAARYGLTLQFVVTTTNKRALEALLGATLAHELLGKPYDLDALVWAVRRTLVRDRT